MGRSHKCVFPSHLPSLTFFLMQTVLLESPFGEITQSPLPTLPFECEVQKNPGDSVIWDSISLQIIYCIIQVCPPDKDRWFGSGGGLGICNMKKLFHWWNLVFYLFGVLFSSIGDFWMDTVRIHSTKEKLWSRTWGKNPCCCILHSLGVSVLWVDMGLWLVSQSASEWNLPLN